MKNRNILASVVLLTFAIATSAQVLHVDSVTVDSVWNSDSSWHDGSGVAQQRQSRDCRIGFVPQGEGVAQMSIALSTDSGKTWDSSSDSLIIIAKALAGAFKTGQRATITVRLLGGDRTGVAFKMIAHQAAPVIIPESNVEVLGGIAALTPGQSIGAVLNLSLANEDSSQGVSGLAKVYWGTNGDGTIDDSTGGANVLALARTMLVPAGAPGQSRTVTALAVDDNGLSSAPCTLTVQFGLQRPMVMKAIAAGTFTMGSSNSIDDGASPPHQVTVSAFTIQETDVTQEQYIAVTGADPSTFRDSLLHPVETVSWYDAVLYCNALSKLSNLDTCYSYTLPGAIDASCDVSTHGYRLPTEAEWEYACRAGSTTTFFWGDTLDGDYCWDFANSPNSTQPVATKLPNAWGLYDMSGNVFQWLNDWYAPYSADAATDPTGATSGSSRSLRGGSWGSDVNVVYLRCAYRVNYTPDTKDYYLGFRCVLR